MTNFQENMIKKIKNNQQYSAEDYYKDGVLYCHKCNTEKEYITPKGNKIPCLCECRVKELKEEEEKIKKQDFIRNNKRHIEKEYRDIYLKDIDFLEEEYFFAEKFIDEFEKFQKMKLGLYIFGEVGNGKTTIASAIANELLEKQYKVLMMPSNIAISKINSGDGNNQDNINHFKQTLIDMDCIILDDFGATRETAYQLEKIYNLINFLYESRKVVVITSNITRKDLGNEEDLAKKRIFDRIIQMTYGCLIKRQGVRKDIAKENQKNVNEIFKRSVKNETFKN